MSKEVKIPFQEDFRERMLEGLKTCTSRTKKYGNPGDFFQIFGTTFQIIDVKQHYLGFVAKFLYVDEGFQRSSDFEQIWQKLHPIKGWQPAQIVFTHYFKRVEAKTAFEKSQGELF